jgi:ABC-type multidrug transport system ATPase subunit
VYSKDAKGRAASLSSFAWYDVRCSYTNKAGSEKTVLHGVSGYLEGGQMLAVIGKCGI